MTELMLDTQASSRIIKAESGVVTRMRRFGAKSLSTSSITTAQLLYGTRLREHHPSIMAAVRAFLARILVHPWDEQAAEVRAQIRVTAKRMGRSAGAFDIMIAAHAESLGLTLVTNDAAIRNLKIEGLKVVT